MIPAVGYNSTDGLGFGVGGEVYSRPAGQAYGYQWKATGGLWSTVGLAYQSHYLRLDWRGEQHWAGKLGYRQWNDMLYAGTGGEDVHLDRADAEKGNSVAGPYGFVGVAFPLPNAPLAPYVQTYFRTVEVEPAAGGLLDARKPFAATGGTYVDVTTGIELDTTDKWPLPSRGRRAEASVAGGLTWARPSDGAERETAAIVQLHAELIEWIPLAAERLVLGARVVGDRTFGRRPFFEQDVVGGRWRDELGSDQLLSGYGRTRTRGDGVVAGLVELRPFFGRTHHSFWDVAVYGSLYAEQAYLFDGARPGPALPSVGFAPEFLWQGALQLRPYAALGWRADAPGLQRRPHPQFGISFLDPL